MFLNTYWDEQSNDEYAKWNNTRCKRLTVLFSNMPDFSWRTPHTLQRTAGKAPCAIPYIQQHVYPNKSGLQNAAPWLHGAVATYSLTWFLDGTGSSNDMHEGFGSL